MRVLITGGAGFIGSHIAEHYQGKAEVRILDNLRTGYLANLEGLDVDFIAGDILDKDTLAKAMEGVDYVFHLAAMISVPESMEKPVECVRMNAEGTLNVLEAAAAADAKKLCFSTSAAIYGDNPEIPKRETMFPEPKSPYAVTKLDGEYYCAMFTREGKLPTVALRYFNVFGPRQDPVAGQVGPVRSHSQGLFEGLDRVGGSHAHHSHFPSEVVFELESHFQGVLVQGIDNGGYAYREKR